MSVYGSQRWLKNPPPSVPVDFAHPLLAGLYWMNRGTRDYCAPFAPHLRGYTATSGSDYTTGVGVAKQGAFGTCNSTTGGTTVIDQTNAELFGQTYAGPTTIFGVWSFATAPVNNERMFAMYGGGATGARREIFTDTVSRVRVSFGRTNFNAVFTFAGERTLNAVAAMHYGSGNAVTIYLRRGNEILKYTSTDSGEPIDGTATARVETARGGAGSPEVYLAGVKRGAWTDSEALRWLRDPWQIYQPRHAPMYVDVPAAAAFNPAWARGANRYIGGGIHVS